MVDSSCTGGAGNVKDALSLRLFGVSLLCRRLLSSSPRQVVARCRLGISATNVARVENRPSSAPSLRHRSGRPLPRPWDLDSVQTRGQDSPPASWSTGSSLVRDDLRRQTAPPAVTWLDTAGDLPQPIEGLGASARISTTKPATGHHPRFVIPRADDLGLVDALAVEERCQWTLRGSRR